MKYITSTAIQRFEQKWGGEELAEFGSYDNMESMVAIMGVYRAMVSSGSKTHDAAFSIAWDTIEQNSDYPIFGEQSFEMRNDLSDLLEDFDFNSLSKTNSSMLYDDGVSYSMLMLSIEELIRDLREEFEGSVQDRIDDMRP